MAVNRFQTVRLSGISDVASELRLKPDADTVGDSGSRDWQFEPRLRGNFGSLCVIEHMPGARAGKHLLRFYVMAIDRIQNQRKPGRQVKLWDGAPGPR